MKRPITRIALLMMLWALAVPCAAETGTVPATANLWGAGHDTPPAPGGGGAGILPYLISLPHGADRVVRFSSITGSVNYGPGWNGPDGVPIPCGSVESYDGLAGNLNTGRARYLAGVFLDDTEPIYPPPPRIDFGFNVGFSELWPQFRQTFFVGDGLTGEGDGDVQAFHVPAGATRMFLGFLDRLNCTSPPGYYGDNSGAIYLEGEITGIFDSDSDGVPDEEDICPGGDDNVDTDTDGVPDFCDACPLDAANDGDGDGYCADVDACPGGDDNLNADGDELPDFCDVCPLDPENDADADGICESDDNCPLVANENQSDLDGDLLGDACDDDIDGDGVENAADNCSYDGNTDQSDIDGDGAGDLCDADLDGDGVVDADDPCVPSPVGAIVNADGCAISDLAPCEHSVGEDRWKNHGAYVSAVAHAAKAFRDAGLITEVERDLVVSEAGNSTCGSKNK